jgi:hypothetical protein
MPPKQQPSKKTVEKAKAKIVEVKKQLICRKTAKQIIFICHF